MTFSKVSSPLNALCQLSIELIFENFHQLQVVGAELGARRVVRGGGGAKAKVFLVGVGVGVGLVSVERGRERAKKRTRVGMVEMWCVPRVCWHVG